MAPELDMCLPSNEGDAKWNEHPPRSSAPSSLMPTTSRARH